MYNAEDGKEVSLCGPGNGALMHYNILDGIPFDLFSTDYMRII
jgi:hypothetical protein